MAATPKQLRDLAKRINKCADLADKFQLLDERGGYVDSQLGVLATDLEVQADRLEKK